MLVRSFCVWSSAGNIADACTFGQSICQTRDAQTRSTAPLLITCGDMVKRSADPWGPWDRTVPLASMKLSEFLCQSLVQVSHVHVFESSRRLQHTVPGPYRC